MGNLFELKRNLESDCKQSLDWDRFQDLVKSLKLAQSSLKMGCPKQALKVIDQILEGIYWC